MTTLISALPVWVVLAIFAASAAAVWLGGSQLVRYVDVLTQKTGLGHAFTGMLFLGGITSLPEVAAVSTSAALGNAPLAINNLLGTASINIILLAFADVAYGRDALTKAAAEPATLMQGVLLMLLASIVALLAVVGDIAILGLGLGVGSTILAVGVFAALGISSRFEHRHVWEVVRTEEQAVDTERRSDRPSVWTLPHLVTAISICTIVILTGGILLAISANVVADATGIASGIVGFLLIGLATSLPELSSITAAVRLGRYQMAVGDIFGTNLFNILLIFLADLVYRGGPVLAEVGRFEAVGAILAILLTAIFVVGLLERRDRTLLRMGYDSLAAILVFSVGLFLLFRVTPS